MHLHLRLIGVRAQIEGHGQGHYAVAGRLRKHVERAFDTIDGLFERRGHGLGDGLWIGARVGGLDHDGGRHDFGIFADGQPEQRQQSHGEDGNRENTGENGAPDEIM